MGQASFRDCGGLIMMIYEIKNILSYNPENGCFLWLVNRSNGVKAGDSPGRVDKEGYLRITILGKAFGAHRLAWLFWHGELPNPGIDHINGNRLDNRISNLRLASISQNNQNRKSVGATFNKKVGKWQAQIKKGDKSFYLGVFETKDEAIEVYRKKSVELFGEFSRWSQA